VFQRVDGATRLRAAVGPRSEPRTRAEAVTRRDRGRSAGCRGPPTRTRHRPLGRSGPCAEVLRGAHRLRRSSRSGPRDATALIPPAGLDPLRWTARTRPRRFRGGAGRRRTRGVRVAAAVPGRRGRARPRRRDVVVGNVLVLCFLVSLACFSGECWFWLRVRLDRPADKPARVSVGSRTTCATTGFHDDESALAA
jgi:hypothetical protein